MNGLLTIMVLAAIFGIAQCEYVELFEEFKLRYGRNYASTDEELHRFMNFVKNMEMATRMAMSNPHASFGVTMFSDWSTSEWESMVKCRRGRKRSSKAKVMKVSEKDMQRAEGESIDWRTKGAVTPVKNQGQCGSCWSFGTTGNIEGQWFLAGNNLTSLSEQQFVSCDILDSGCGGGNAETAMDWIVRYRNGVVVSDASYPYTSGGGITPACFKNITSLGTGAVVIGHSTLPQDEKAIAAFVYKNGPVAIGVDAAGWSSYNSGIVTNCSGHYIDHEVLIVGFDDMNNPPYWIIKNSWAASWGEKGYIRLAMGSNQCGLKYSVTTAHVMRHTVFPSPQPLTPVPVPNPYFFNMTTCSDDKCSIGCTSVITDLNICMPTGLTGSQYGINYCNATDMVEIAFEYVNCTGAQTILSSTPITLTCTYNATAKQSSINYCTKY